MTIPAEIREAAGLLPHTEVEIAFDGKGVRILRARRPKKELAWLRTQGGEATSR